MLNNMYSMVNNFGLGKYFDKYGYNVLEIPYDEYNLVEENVTSFVNASDELAIIVIDEFGNSEDIKGSENLVIVYSKKVWEENGLI